MFDQSAVNYSFFFFILVTLLVFCYVTVPTCGDNILDLLLCNCPDVIDSVCVVQGISDYNMVIADILYPFRQNHDDTARKVFLYDKGDYESIICCLKNFYPSFSVACTRQTQTHCG